MADLGKHPSYNISTSVSASVVNKDATTAAITIKFTSIVGTSTEVYSSGVKVGVMCDGKSKGPDAIVGCKTSGSYDKAGTYTKEYLFDIARTKDEQSISYTAKAYTQASVDIGSYTGTVTVDALPTYTITYRANNDNATGSTSNQTKTHGTDITLRTNGYSLTNHKFIGWNTVANGSGTSYAAGANYTKNEAVTLYAQWELDEYTITFDSNGGTDGPTTQSINASGGTLTVQTPKFIGYTFRGWDTSPDSVTPVYMPGDSITIDSNIILYAVWDAWNYTVTFDANGGYGDLPADINILGDDTAIIGYERPSSDGSRAFICWNTLPSGYGKSYYPGDYFCEPENGTIITLYAMYRNTDIYLNSDGTIECLEFIEDYDCQFPMIEKTGRIIAKEFIEHDGEIMIQGGIIYAKSFIEATRPFLLGKASKVYTMTDSTGAIITDNDGYILVGKFI